MQLNGKVNFKALSPRPATTYEPVGRENVTQPAFLGETGKKAYVQPRLCPLHSYNTKSAITLSQNH